MLELCTALHDKPVEGVRIGAVSNAGFETVGIADAIRGQRYRVQIAELVRGRRREAGGGDGRAAACRASSTRATRSTSRRWPRRTRTRAPSA